MLKNISIIFLFFLIFSGCFYVQPDEVRPVHVDQRIVMNGPRYATTNGRRYVDNRSWIYICERHRHGWVARCYWRRNYFYVTHY